jgi:hypothetical protein
MLIKTNKFILLDMDGVMVPAASWKPIEILPDGFYQFSPAAALYLDALLKETGATIVLTTTHRTRFDKAAWNSILGSRLQYVQDIQTIDDFNLQFTSGKRLSEVSQWAQTYGQDKQYVIIDDDSSLHDLPPEIKSHWVKTESMIGFNKETLEQALHIFS